MDPTQKYAVALELLGQVLSSTPYQLNDVFRGRILHGILAGLEANDCRFFISDGRYLCLPGESTFYDMVSGQDIGETLPGDPVVSVALDGMELLRRRVKERTGKA